MANKVNLKFCQGDIMFIKANTDNGFFPQEQKDDYIRDGRLVIETGEKTGHAHTIDAEEASLAMVGLMFSGHAAYADVKKNGRRVETIMVTAESALVTHEEHEPLELPKGVYLIKRQRQHDYDASLSTWSSERTQPRFAFD